ncbi:MAG: outer membrane beta-barrel protein [Bacteroidetes bacterium]|nr:outer membrane beta-barrel protein [Bacteroidota bacterium]
MKLATITILFILFFILETKSQFSIRPQIGIKFTDISYESINAQLEGVPKLVFGADVQVGNMLYVQPGINYTPIKLNIKEVGDIRMSNLNLPILVGLKLFEPEDKRALGIRFYAGPNISYALNKKINSRSKLLSDAIITPNELKDLHLSALAGAGIDFGFFFLDMGYKYGITKFISGDNNKTATLNSFMLNAGIRLGR